MNQNQEPGIWHRYPRICHYTTAESALRILKSKCLHATRFDYLEDQTEIRFAINLIRDMYHEMAMELGLALTDQEINEEIDRLYYGSLGNEVFISCFSKIPIEISLNENDGILSMWRYYGRTDGCYIEFDSRRLFEPAERVCPTALVDEVIYSCNEQPEVTRLRELSRRVVNIVVNPCNSGGLRDFFELISRCKHPAFVDEREIRLAILNGLPNCSQGALEVLGLAVKPYVRYPFSTDAIKKIVFGPAGVSKTIGDEIERYIMQSEEYRNLTIEKSTIPVLISKE